MEKFIRAFAHGLEEGGELRVTVNNVEYVFTAEHAQQDIEITDGSKNPEQPPAE